MQPQSSVLTHSEDVPWNLWTSEVCAVQCGRQGCGRIFCTQSRSLLLCSREPQCWVYEPLLFFLFYLTSCRALFLFLFFWQGLCSPGTADQAGLDLLAWPIHPAGSCVLVTQPSLFPAHISPAVGTCLTATGKVKFHQRTTPHILPTLEGQWCSFPGQTDRQTEYYHVLQTHHIRNYWDGAQGLVWP